MYILEQTKPQFQTLYFSSGVMSTSKLQFSERKTRRSVWLCAYVPWGLEGRRISERGRLGGNKFTTCGAISVSPLRGHQPQTTGCERIPRCRKRRRQRQG